MVGEKTWVKVREMPLFTKDQAAKEKGCRETQRLTGMDQAKPQFGLYLQITFSNMWKFKQEFDLRLTSALVISKYCVVCIFLIYSETDSEIFQIDSLHWHGSFWSLSIVGPVLNLKNIRFILSDSIDKILFKLCKKKIHIHIRYINVEFLFLLFC